MNIEYTTELIKEKENELHYTTGNIQRDHLDVVYPTTYLQTLTDAV